MNTELQTVEKLNSAWQHLPASEIIAHAITHFGNSVGFATSLGAEDQVITHYMAGCNKDSYIFTLDTGRMFPEVYDLLHLTSSRYGIRIRVMFPDAAEVEEMVNASGINLFYDSIENRKLCCEIRKIRPLKRALLGLDAWITGLRRQQSVTRSDMQVVEWDEANRLIKINPLAGWSEEQVWETISNQQIPFNPLHKLGYPSIGCQPCTRAVNPGDDIRSGRWWWEQPGQKECGLHPSRH